MVLPGACLIAFDYLYKRTCGCVVSVRKQFEVHVCKIVKMAEDWQTFLEKMSEDEFLAIVDGENITYMCIC